MEEFEMLRLTPDFETLRLTCDFKTLRQTPVRPPARRNISKIGKLRLAEDFEMLRLTPDFETLRLTCDFKTLRQTPVRRPPDATFQNIAPDARQTQHFEIRRQAQDFKIMCQTLYSVTMRQTCSTSLAMYTLGALLRKWWSTLTVPFIKSALITTLISSQNGVVESSANEVQNKSGLLRAICRKTHRCHCFLCNSKEASLRFSWVWTMESGLPIENSNGKSGLQGPDPLESQKCLLGYA